MNLIPFRQGIWWPNFDKSEELIDTAFQMVGQMDGEPELAALLRERIRSTSGKVGDAKRMVTWFCAKLQTQAHKHTCA